MAGFLFNMGDDRDTGIRKDEALIQCLASGVYTARNVKLTDSGRWSTEGLALLADFLSMRVGDHVYFLCSRNIYGIGRLVSLANQHCSVGNFPEACRPAMPKYGQVKKLLLSDDGSDRSLGTRWLCTFEPSPRFFSKGVDMDVALSSRPQSMRRLPSNEGRTFLKLDDEEDRILSQLVLLTNRNRLDDTDELGPFGADAHAYQESHARLSSLLDATDYSLDVSAIVPKHRDGRRLEPEMALEAVLMDRLQRGVLEETSIFGQFDYLAHQVPASPTKPFKWMDKMDLFGYAYADVRNLGGIESPIVRYGVIELKQGKAKSADISQLMSYVDWITTHWAGQDPSLVDAFLVAASFPDEVLLAAERDGLRHYTVGRREESMTHTWRRLDLVSYTCDRKTMTVAFELARSSVSEQVSPGTLVQTAL